MTPLPTDAQRRAKYVPLNTASTAPLCECGRPVNPSDAAAGCPLCLRCLHGPPLRVVA